MAKYWVIWKKYEVILELTETSAELELELFSELLVEKEDY